MEIVIFELEQQRYGLPAEDVHEVVRVVTIVPLPNAPDVIEGIIDVRGTVTAVLDVRKRFRLPPKPLEPSDQFVLASAGKRDVALRVDRATELIRIDPTDVDDAKEVVPGQEYITGVAKLPDGLVLIHDLLTFLSEAESVVLAEALAPAEASREQT